jgi:anthranilate synthase/aminodeoxychorismate synthase-like glutamine amidotransferase
MILVIDNYDSFTFNLVQYLGELGVDLQVYRNDQIDLRKVKQLSPSGIVISPGPGRPEQAGITVSLILEFASQMPILGVCLGHQAIGLAFGGTVVRAPKVMHGKTSEIYHKNDGILNGLTNPFKATRYHSLIVEHKGLPSQLEVTAETEDKIIMGLKHEAHPVYGVQFHPESILTFEGKKILENFLEICE